MYRLSVRIGTTSTSARYERADESEALRLSPIARDLSSAPFVAGGTVQVDLLAETLRGIVGAATEELGEHPGSVEVTYPASWDSRQLLLLWEALVLAGIPDAATRPVPDPKPAPLVQVSSVDDSETSTEIVSTPSVPAQAPAEIAALALPQTSRRKRVRWVVAATVTVVAGVLAGLIATGTPRAARTADDAASGGNTSPVGQTPPSATTSSTPDGGVALPASDPLGAQQFIIPRGKDAATQLNLANVAGVVGPRRLSNAGGRNSWPMLSADRRTIIYINYVAGTSRTMAADGTGDRRLISPQPKLRRDHPCVLESGRSVDHGGRVSRRRSARQAAGDQARWHSGTAAEDE